MGFLYTSCDGWPWKPAENCPPDVEILEQDVSVPNGVFQTFTTFAHDPDEDDELFFSWYVDDVLLPDEIESEISLAYTPESATNYAVRVKLSDGELTDEDTVILTVEGPLGGAVLLLIIELPDEEPVQFSGNPVTLAFGQSMTVTASLDVAVDLYSWFLDGNALISGVDSTTATVGNTLALGIHRLTLVARVGDYDSSSSIEFEVVADG